MTTWLIDTYLFKALAPGAPPVARKWLQAEEASVYLSAASLVGLNEAIGGLSESQRQGRDAMRLWLDRLVSKFADRIHPVDLPIALRAGKLMADRRRQSPIHFHDAVLVATAQIHGHGLLTRRDRDFGAWTQTPLKILD